ncbi:MAG: PHP domain-containing protein [Magnetococcales bacterium]|nr:PHP domain-containing protein [Magnetococcales bacterium]
MKQQQRESWFIPSSARTIPAWEYHAHTIHSDGQTDMETMVNRAVACQLQRLIFTEHTEPDMHPRQDWFRNYADDVQEWRQRSATVIDVRLGLEVPVVDFTGTVVMSDEMAEQSDFILGAVHAYPGYGWQLQQLEPELAIDIEFRASMGLLDNRNIDAIAHIGGICQRFVTPFPLELFDEVVRKAVDRGIAVELNPAYHQPMQPYFDCCRRHGAWITPGSNAHGPEDLGLAYAQLAQRVSMTS